MSYDEHQAMWPQMIAALAAIDAALGLPEDGCNSLAQTLAAIKELKDGRDAFQESLYDELDTNFRLRDLGCARADEPMTPFIERVIAERDTMRAALTELLACHTESAGFTTSMLADRAEFDAMLQRSQERIETAVGAARVALGPNAELTGRRP